jgi:hypothetical protein
VVMANASEEVRALARRRGWEQTASNDDDGVAQVVEAILRQSSGTEGNTAAEITASPVVEFAQ